MRPALLAEAGAAGFRYAVSFDDERPVVADAGGLKPSCLGPPESPRIP
jgi:hypothetical protein